MYKKQVTVSRVIASLCLLIVVLGLAGCKPTVKHRASQRHDVISTTTVLAKTAYTDSAGDQSRVSAYFSKKGDSVTYVTTSPEGYRVVHRNQLGPLVQTLDAIVLSPDGTRIAYSALKDGTWGMFIDGVRAGKSDSVTEPAFSPDSRHLAYGLERNGKEYLVLDGRELSGGFAAVNAPAFSKDSARIIYAARKNEKDPLRLIVADLTLKTLFSIVHCGSGLMVSPDNEQFAALQEAGKRKRVIVAHFDRPEKAERGPEYDEISQITFSADGKSIAYLGLRDGKRYVVLNGKEEEYPQGNVPGNMVIRADHKGVAFFLLDQKGWHLYEAFARDKKYQQTVYEEAANLTANPVSNQYAFAVRRGDKWLLVVDGSEGPEYDKVVSPLFSPDGSVLVYRVRRGADRFVVAKYLRGGTEKMLPSYEMVQQPVFLDDNTTIAYGVKEGNKLIWKVDSVQ